MDDFPGSKRHQYPSKSEFQNNSITEPSEDKQVEEGDKKVQKVIKGEAKTRKRPMHKRIFESFIGGQPENVSEHVIFEVMIPAARDLVVDGFMSAIESTFYPAGRSNRRRFSTFSSGGSGFGASQYGHTNYQSPSARRPDPREEATSRRVKAHDFREIILDTRVEADEVIDRLFDLISKYELATVADLYDLCGMSSTWADRNHGWTDIRGAGATRIRGGQYLLNLPRPEPLK